MPTYTTADIRNLALLGHGAAGKTSLTEAMLFKAGAIHQLGLVDKGSTVSDYNDEEKAHGHGIYTSILHCDFQGKHINIIDTPGYPDFIGQAFLALPAVETAVVVVSAAAGVEPNTRKVMERATARNLCRFVIINKIDHENIDLPKVLEQVRSNFGRECLPINLPAEGGKAVVDCFFKATGPDTDFSSVAEAHKAVIEQVVEVDEDLMATYLDQGEVKPEQLLSPFKKALREGHLIPVVFVSARRHDKHDESVGIAELLDILVKLAPSPLDGNVKPFAKGADKTPVTLVPDAKKHVVAHVFQVTIDPFVGKLAAFRVHQGTITPQTQLIVNDPKSGEGKKPFKVSHLFKFQGKEHVEVDAAIAGDIVAVAKVEEIHRGAVLHDHHDDDHIAYQSLGYPLPMYGLAITAKRRGDEQKIAEALAKIGEEDPTFQLVRDSSTHEQVVRGLGEVHLRMILERMKNRYHVEVDTKPPKIAYRETIMAKADGHHRHKKQTGGAGQFGEVYLRVVPLERGKGFEYVDDTFGGSVPKQYIPAIEKGVRLVLDTGAIAGYPIHDVRVEVYDGKYHDVDSKEIAFVTAGKRAFIDAFTKARPAVLEPVVQIEVTVPAQYMGDIAGDLSGKRGRIQGTDMLGSDLAVIKAMVPLAEVANYQNQLKSVTGGQGSYSMELSHYDPVPPHVQQQIVAAWKPKLEED